MTPMKAVAVAMVIAAAWTMAAAQALAGATLPIALVVRGATVAQPFGCTTLALEPFDPYCPSRHFHSGVDLAAPEGTAVHAAAGGRAESGYDAAACGLYVVVSVDDHVRMLYCHLSHVAAESGSVCAGDVLGDVGSSGLATGPHLHFEIQLDGRAVDPVRWLSAAGS